MEGLRTYLLGIMATALVCGLLPELLQSGGLKTLVKAAAGLLLAMAILRPLGNGTLRLPALPGEWEQTASQAGQQAYLDALAPIIKAETEAYILDKAAGLGASLQVQVTLSGDSPPVPEGVRLSGAVSREIQAKLEQILTKDLGIAKEDQVWIG